MLQGKIIKKNIYLIKCNLSEIEKIFKHLFLNFLSILSIYWIFLKRLNLHEKKWPGRHRPEIYHYLL